MRILIFIIFLSYRTIIHAISISEFARKLYKIDHRHEQGLHRPLLIIENERGNDEHGSFLGYDYYLPESVQVELTKESETPSTTKDKSSAVSSLMDGILSPPKSHNFELKFKTKRSEWEFYLCPPEKQEDVKLVAQLMEYYWGARYCLLEKTFSGKQQKVCKKEVKPVIISQESILGYGKCGPSRAKDLLLFVYPYCDGAKLLKIMLKELQEDRVRKYTENSFPIDQPLMKMYEICFDKDDQQTYYTHHHIFPSLLKNEKFLLNHTDESENIDSKIQHVEESSPHSLDADLIDLRDPEEEQKKKKAESKRPLSPDADLIDLRDPEEEQQQHADSEDTSSQFYHEKLKKFSEWKEAFENQSGDEPRMAARLLVPTEDMPFPLWKKSTLSYFNISALWIELVPILELINDRIRQLSIQSNRELSIYTSAVGIDFEKKVLLYLNNNTNLLIPNLWCKIVHDKEKKLATAVMIHNTPGIYFADELCKEHERVICNFIDWLETTTLENVDKEKIELAINYTYCCKVTPSMQKFFSITDIEDSIINLNYAPDNNSNIDEITVAE